MNSPAVSVCMITFNQAAYIEQAVLSAIEQETTFDCEIVVGDDCSTDDTHRILASLAQRHPRIRLLPRERNLGINRNLASTLSECRGAYVALLEGDDYWTDRTKLQRQYEFLESHPDHAICFHSARVRQDGQKEIKIPRARIPKRTKLQDLVERGNFIPTPTVMFRNRQPATFPEWFYDLRIGDLPLNIMNALGGDIGFLDRTMAVYRMHAGGSFSATSNHARVDEVVRMYEHLKTFLGSPHDRTITGIQGYWKAVQGFTSGDECSGRANARVRLGTPPRNRQWFMAALMVYATPLYRMVRLFRAGPR